ncbi:MAG TPA: hypothetical protein VHN98_04200, partial [Acidimicrobiales bacterium]|nr:hypothetical protein [Acidimicrobiales bacterium]
AGALATSARAAGARAVASGQWLANVFLEVAPHVPIRDAATLREHHRGMSGAALAEELIRNASRVSAAVGAASGAMIGAEELAPPAWITVPFELVVETLIVAAVELKLVAELHEVYGRPVSGTGMERTLALVQAWAQRRGVTPGAVVRNGGIGEALGRGTRNEVVRMVRRRLVARLGRNSASMAPLFAGVLAGAEVNRRATRSLGEAVIRDLATRR